MDAEDDTSAESEQTGFGHRYGVTIMTIVLGALLVLVIAVQVGC
jgi:hypothetical protein